MKNEDRDTLEAVTERLGSLECEVESLKKDKQELQDRLLRLGREHAAKDQSLRNSVTFRAGEALVAAATSFRGAVALPFTFLRIYRDYRSKESRRPRPRRVASEKLEGPVHKLESAGSNGPVIMPTAQGRRIMEDRTRTETKHDSEVQFWRSRLEIDEGEFKNSWYQRIMLAMAQEPNDGFLHGKIVADFGCGPRGSLVWASSAALRIGIDVLADRYADEFTDNIVSHGMVYLKSTEKVIPLPSGFVDILFTLNAIDHVDDFSAMCGEILRVLKPGGEFIGSFNLNEPPSVNEPQQLDEKIIEENLLDFLAVQSYRITKKGPKGDQYASFFDGTLSYKPGQEGYLWVRARKTGL